ncbi:hypothetical protein ACIQLJ_15640 [Microbacterium sp. NPDC091313]
MRAALAALVAAALLAGCAPVHDPALVRTGAERVFDTLVAEMSAADAGSIRAVEVTPPADQACAGESGGTQTAFVVTGTASVTAPDGAVGDTAQALAAALDSEVWQPIRVGDGASDQRAWASLDGVTVTITRQDPLLVAAVFTPCTPSS